MSVQLQWNTATEWDNAQSESGIVHESVANSDHNDATIVKQGYPLASPLFSASLTGLWALNEDSTGTIYDFSGNNNDGSNTGGTPGSTGLLGTTTWSFTGDSGDHLTTGKSALSPPFTYAIWVNSNKTSSKNDHFYGAVDHNNKNGAWLEIVYGGSGGKWRFGVGDGNYALIDGAAGGVNHGVWNLVVGTYKSGTARLYVNATEVNNNTSVSGYTAPSQNVTIANADPGTFNTIDGSLAYPMTLNKALSASEIQTYYDVVKTAGNLTTAKKTA